MTDFVISVQSLQVTHHFCCFEITSGMMWSEQVKTQFQAKISSSIAIRHLTIAHKPPASKAQIGGR